MHNGIVNLLTINQRSGHLCGDVRNQINTFLTIDDEVHNICKMFIIQV